MSETEDVPPADLPPADFVAWMTAEAPELAGAGKRLSRQRQPKILGERAPRRPLRKRGGLKLLIFVVVLATIVSLPFVPGWLHDSPAPVAADSTFRPASDAVFPATLTNLTGTYQREAVSDPGGCGTTAGVSPALVQVAVASGTCRAIRSALYVDAQTRFRIEALVIVMAEPDQVLGLRPLVISPLFGFIPAARELPPGAGKVYTGVMTTGGSTAVLTIGQYFNGNNGDERTLHLAQESVDLSIIDALGLTPPSG